MNIEYLFDIGQQVQIKNMYKTGFILGCMTRKLYNEYYVSYPSDGTRMEEWIPEFELELDNQE